MQPFPVGSWRKLALRPSVSFLAFAGLALPLGAQAPVALFTTDPNPAAGGAPLSVQFLDRSTGTISTWAWDFGDGSISSEQNPLHVFTLLQAFDVSLTVSGPLGSNTITVLHAVDVLATTNGVAGAPPALRTMAVPMPEDIGDFFRDPE